MDELENKKPTYFKEINEYMIQQNIIDLVTNKFPKFKTIYQVYQSITLALRDKVIIRLNELLDNYKNTHTELDTTITTFKKNGSILKTALPHNIQIVPWKESIER